MDVVGFLWWFRGDWMQSELMSQLLNEMMIA